MKRVGTKSQLLDVSHVERLGEALKLRNLEVTKLRNLEFY